jgi:hypothetical protein
MAMSHDFEDAEALRLMRAFHQVKETKTRRLIIAITEALARGAVVNISGPEQKSELPKFDA